MKNKIILALSVIILLSSCANKFSLTKRKYTKGYYFASAKNSSTTKKENKSINISVDKLIAHNTTDLAKSSIDVELKNAPTITTPIFIAHTRVKNNKAKKAKVNLIASKTSKSQSFITTNFKPLSENKHPLININKSKNDDDINLIIMVILCLFPFINLIPIYLHDDKKLTINFLVTLLLDFTWILGVIYALLVIFDVVDLR